MDEIVNHGMWETIKRSARNHKYMAKKPDLMRAMMRNDFFASYNLYQCARKRMEEMGKIFMEE